jgi:hypothetical protein
VQIFQHCVAAVLFFLFGFIYGLRRMHRWLMSEIFDWVHIQIQGVLVLQSVGSLIYFGRRGDH